jgi:pimeloyl-ACP methyl ester carboxylesterase
VSQTSRTFALRVPEPTASVRQGRGEPLLRRGGIRNLDRSDVPVRLVLCQDDWLLPPERHGAMFRDQLPNHEVVELLHVGHVPMYDDPDGIARLIAEHAGAHGNDAADGGRSLAG